jgi:hypothetical protein
LGVAQFRSWATRFGSRIMSDFPEIFAEFRGKLFSLLCRDGRGGFGARDFHNRCDDRASTLTLIEDADWNVFGGSGTKRTGSRPTAGRPIRLCLK